MAVTTTPKRLMDEAYGLSSKNAPGELAGEDTELLRVVNRTGRGLYTLAASINPTFFGRFVELAPPGAGNGWQEPDDSEIVYYIETLEGEEVVPVRLEERDLEPELPKVILRGRTYFSVGQPIDPDPETDQLRLHYSKSYEEASAKTDTVDATWDESHNDIFVFQLGIYLAVKDFGSQSGELPELKGERDRALARFVRRLENQTATIRSRFSSIVPINTHSLVAHRELLDGAAS